MRRDRGPLCRSRYGLARAVGTVQNVTTAFEQFWLPKPLLLGSAQRLKRWGFCRNDPRNLEPVRSAGPPFPSEDLQICTYPTGGPMDLPPWTLQPPMVCGLSVGHLCWRRGFGSCKLRDPKKDPPQYCPAVCWTRLTVHPAGG